MGVVYRWYPLNCDRNLGVSGRGGMARDGWGFSALEGEMSEADKVQALGIFLMIFGGLAMIGSVRSFFRRN